MPPEHNARPGWAWRLREARRERGWDSARLAVELRRAGGRDVSATAESLVRMIRDWERGTYHPRERYRLLLSRVLDVDVDHTAATGSGALVETAGCVAVPAGDRRCARPPASSLRASEPGRGKIQIRSQHRTRNVLTRFTQRPVSCAPSSPVLPVDDLHD